MITHHPSSGARRPVRHACGAALVVFAAAALPAPSAAQTRPVGAATDSAAADSTRRRAAQALQQVRVTVTRDAARSPLELPFAWSRASIDDRPALRRSSVADLLLGVPGVQVQERANPSQDPRIAIRGFGARSAFGVRGVRVLRDGVPLTLPDGQTPLDCAWTSFAARPPRCTATPPVA